MPLEASLAQIHERLSDRVQEEIHTVLPARVLSYNSAAQTVSVQFSVRVAVVDADGEPEWSELPNLSDVPVAFLRGGGFFFAAPLVAGDHVWVYATQADVAQWRATGTTPSEGPTTRLHGLGSAFAVPGAFPVGAPLADASGSELRLGKDGSNAQIHVTSAEIRLGKAATDAVALASKVDAIASALVSHVHSGVTSGPGSSGPSPGLASIPTSTGSALVKVRP